MYFFTLCFQKQSDTQMLTFKLPLLALGLLLAFPGRPRLSLPGTGVELNSSLWPALKLGRWQANIAAKGNRWCRAPRSKLGFVSQGHLFAPPFRDTSEEAFTALEFRMCLSGRKVLVTTFLRLFGKRRPLQEMFSHQHLLPCFPLLVQWLP